MAEYTHPTVELTPALVASSGAMPPFGGTVPVQVRRHGNAFFDGPGIVPGTVKEKGSPDNIPLRRRVRLYRERDGSLVGETWSSAATGAFVFRNVQLGYTYSVISYDSAGNYRAVIADNLTPEVPA